MEIFSDQQHNILSLAAETLDIVADALFDQGYAIVPNALPAELLDSLFVHFTSLDQDDFNRAGIGREQDYQLNRFVRTDEICWLTGEYPTTRAYLDWAENLRLGLNRRLFLGLFDYECHYAYYSPGAYYKKHLDSFQGNNPRRLSSVLYLNPQWQPGDGGELLLYTPGAPDDSRPLQPIAPTYGKLVLFLSEEFPHEVLPSRIKRRSVTGWFRVNGL